MDEPVDECRRNTDYRHRPGVYAGSVRSDYQYFYNPQKTVGSFSFPGDLRTGYGDFRARAALHLGWPVLLAAPDAGDISFWSLCESQSLCRVHGTVDSSSC